MLSDDQQTIDFNDGTKYYLKPIFSKFFIFPHKRSINRLNKNYKGY